MTKDQIMALVDAYATRRIGEGTAKARAAVVAALEGVSSVHTQEPVGEIMHLDELNETWTKHLPIGTKLYTAPQSEDDKALHKLGCEMLAMTTTVHSPHIPFVEQCALVPSVWQKFFDDNKVQSTPQQPAEPLELSDGEIEAVRHDTFSTSNPYCPVNSSSMRKAARAILKAANAKRGTP